MYTTMAVVALTMGMSAAKVSPTPVWESDYRLAMARVSEAGKPMVLIVGSGKNGMEAVVREGSFDPAVSKLLASKFVCVYIDTNTVEGRNLANALQIRNQGVVISDKTGATQAFSSAVAMSRDMLQTTLVKYADADPKGVKKTETIVDPKAPPAPVAPAVMAGPGMMAAGGCGQSYGGGYGNKSGCCFFGGCGKGGYTNSGCGQSTAGGCGQSYGGGCGKSMGGGCCFFGGCGKGGYTRGGCGQSYGGGCGQSYGGGCGKSYGGGFGGGCFGKFCCK